MMTTIRVQPDDLRSRADELSRSARQIAQALSTVDEQLQLVERASLLKGNLADKLMIRYRKTHAGFQRWPDTLLLFAELLNEAADQFERADQVGTSGSAPPGQREYLGEFMRLIGTEDINGPLFATGVGDDDPVHPSDARQGQIRNCYFVTSLALLAEQDPDFIREHIRDNGDGTYTVTLYEDGKPFEVTVTPEFPIAETLNGVQFDPHLAEHGDRQAELWAMLYEKAYATHLGDGNPWDGYLKLDSSAGGSAYNALETLTGEDSRYFSDANSISIEDLARMESEGQAISISSLSGEDSNAQNLDLYRDSTLAQWHAYYITEVNVDAGTVTVQNPWGWDEHRIEIPYDQLDVYFSGMTVNPIR